MISPNEYIDIVIDTDITNIKVDERVNIDIKIENKSQLLLNNCLFRLNLDESIFKLVDPNFDSCINEYGSIGKIQPNSVLNISIPVRIKNSPEDLVSQMYCDMNFNDNEDIYEDLNFTSRMFNIAFCHPDAFSKEDFLYWVDREEVHEGDIITHNIEISNNSNTSITNLRLCNMSEIEHQVIENSFRLNGVHQLHTFSINSINIGIIEVGESVKIEFKTRVAKSNDDINLRFAIEYIIRKHKIIQKSNNINVKMRYPLINKQSFIKNVNKENIFIGDIVNFEITVQNIGNSDANNILILDEIDKNLEYVDDSLCIDTIANSNSIFREGIIIQKLKPDEKVVITYKAKAINISNNIETFASCEYTSINKTQITSTKSNNTEVTVHGVIIGNNNIKKIFNTNHAQIGDIITACIEIENNGNIDCESLKLCDDISSSLEFIENSLRIDGNLIEGEDIFKGVSIDRVLANKSITITYQLKILDIPNPNPIIDKATLYYSYIQNNQVKSNTVYSSKTKLYVYKPNLHILDHEVSRINDKHIKYSNTKDLICFRLMLENKGNVGLENIYLKINLPKELSMEYTSLKVNNSVYSKFIDDKILLPNLNISQKMYIEFDIKHSHVKDYEIETLMNFEYEFRDIERKNIYKDVDKLRHTILVTNPKLEFYQELSNKEIKKDEEFVQSIVVKNTGNIKYEKINIHINDQVLSNSLDNKCMINGEEALLESTLQHRELDIGEELKIQIPCKPNTDDKEKIIKEHYLSANYRILPDQIKKVDMYSNKVKLKLVDTNLKIEGKCSDEVLFMGQKYTYIYKICNTGNIDLTNLKINLNLPSNLEYISDTFYVDNRLKDVYLDNETIEIGSLKINQFINVCFDFKVNKLIKEDKVQINCIVDAEYIVSDKNESKIFSSKNSELIIQNKSLEIIKCASHEYIQKGDILKIQNILNNTGTIDFKDILFVDNKNENLRFIKDSVYVDGVNITNINPIDGIFIKELNSLHNVLISYEYEYIPHKYINNIIQFSEVNYFYKINDSKTIQEKQISNKICIEGGVSTFKQFNIENKYLLESEEPDLYDIMSAYTDARIDKIHEISTISKQSIDNYNATGKKVIIKGTVMNRIEYIAKGSHSSLYLIERQHPFTISINIPGDYHSEDIDFRVKCDDVFCKINNKRSLYISTLISIDGLI